MEHLVSSVICDFSKGKELNTALFVKYEKLVRLQTSSSISSLPSWAHLGISEQMLKLDSTILQLDSVEQCYLLWRKGRGLGGYSSPNISEEGAS